MSIYQPRHKITAAIESNLARMNPYLHAKWDEQERCFKIYLGHKLIYSPKHIDARIYERLEAIGGWERYDKKKGR